MRLEKRFRRKFTTTIHKPILSIPKHWLTTADYIGQFMRENHLIACAHRIEGSIQVRPIKHREEEYCREDYT